MENRQRYKTPSSKTDGGNGSGSVSNYQQLLSNALRLLSIRPRSTSEILRYLQNKSKDSILINKVIDQLKTLKFIDDEKFAQWVVESYSRSRPKGKPLLIRILRQKGISEEIIGKVLPNSDSETESAMLLLSKKRNRWKNLPDQVFRQKASRFLYSRGFTWDIIERALKKGYNSSNVNSDTDL